MKNMFLPHAENSFAFTVIGSPLSLVLSAVVIAAAAAALVLFFKRR